MNKPKFTLDELEEMLKQREEAHKTDLEKKIPVPPQHHDTPHLPQMPKAAPQKKIRKGTQKGS